MTPEDYQDSLRSFVQSEDDATRRLHDDGLDTHIINAAALIMLQRHSCIIQLSYFLLCLLFVVSEAEKLSSGEDVKNFVERHIEGYEVCLL